MTSAVVVVVATVVEVVVVDAFKGNMTPPPMYANVGGWVAITS